MTDLSTATLTINQPMAEGNPHKVTTHSAYEQLFTEHTHGGL